MAKKRAKASLRILSTNLSVKQISEKLREEPSTSGEKGELMSPRNPQSQRREEAIWILQSNLSDEEEMEIHLANLVSFIESRYQEFRSLAKDCSIDIFCGFFLGGGQGGFMVPSDITHRLSGIPVDIIFDVYAADTEEEEPLT